MTTIKKFYNSIRGYNNRLNTLEYTPKEVTDLNCTGNELVTLRYTPEKLNGVFIYLNEDWDLIYKVTYKEPIWALKLLKEHRIDLF
jgi:hypothetical protein